MDKKSHSPVPPKKGEKKKDPGMSFVEAIGKIKSGKKVQRLEWVDKSEFCLLKDNFLMIHRNNKFHTWIVSEGDLMADDWVAI